MTIQCVLWRTAADGRRRKTRRGHAKYATNPYVVRPYGRAGRGVDGDRFLCGSNNAASSLPALTRPNAVNAINAGRPITGCHQRHWPSAVVALCPTRGRRRPGERCAPFYFSFAIYSARTVSRRRHHHRRLRRRHYRHHRHTGCTSTSVYALKLICHRRSYISADIQTNGNPECRLGCSPLAPRNCF